MIHLALHAMVPLFVSLVFFRRRWHFALLVMLATMLVDLDHLLATPIYDPQRCSIGFHPLHQLWLIVAYACLTLPSATRLVGLGLLIHMALDSVDCRINSGAWIYGDAVAGLGLGP